MTAPVCSDKDFVEGWIKYGPRGLAKRLGVTERGLFARRQRLEARGYSFQTSHDSWPGVRMPSYPWRADLRVMDGVVLVASDAHYWPGPASVMHRALVMFCKEYKPKAVIYNGDVIDAVTISKYPPIGWEKRPSLADEIEVAKERLAEVEKAAFKAEKIWNLGNHDCLDAETECLTRRGWVRHEEIRQDDSVFSWAGHIGEWTPIDEIVSFPYDGPMLRVEKTRLSLSVTPNHRVLLRRLNWRSKRFDIEEYRRADGLPYSFDLPSSAQSCNGGAGLLDDEIALAGWVLTDGGFGNGHVSIYQSKPHGIARIEELIGRLGYEVSRYDRQRGKRVICGREAVNEPLPSVQFLFSAVSSRKAMEYVPSKKLPEWVWDLDGRQFQVFLDALMDGDGVWDGRPEAKTCGVLYGHKWFLDSVQAIAVQHGWRARVSEDTRGDYRLCLSKIGHLRVEQSDRSWEPYKGTVWCLRVPHGNFMVRRNGCAYFTGNSRFETRIATVAPEYAKVHGVHLRDHFPLWKPCWSAWINGDVVVKHRFKGGMYAPRNNTLYAGKTVVTGHLHSAKVMPLTDYNGTRYGVDGGCIAETDSKAFIDYTEDNPLDWRSAFCVLTFRGGRLLQPELVLKWEGKRVQFRGEVFTP